MTNEHGAILQRLEKLERQNWRMKLAGLGAVVIAGAFLLVGQATQSTPSELKARSFVLVDEQGRTRATLEMYNGSPRLALSDTDGKTRASLAVSSDGPALGLGDKKSSLLLAVSSEGSWLALSGANGKPRATLTETGVGSALTLFDANGKPSTLLHESSDGPGLGLSDVNGFETDIGTTELVTPATGETHKTSAASIVLFGKDRKVLWSVPPQN